MKIFRINKYYKKLIKYDIKIIKNIKSLDLNKNFVLSALNLAFLGSLVKKELKLYNELIHWPDGKYSLNFTKNLKKIPGRDLINKINLKGNINRIVVVGDLPDVAKKFIEKKFHRKVINYKVPYGNIKEITNNLKIKLKKKDLCFTTLPTPKQERVAEYIVSKNKKFKIICIGGSINIASGIEKAVPKLFNKFEFLWRLQYDSSRRLKRLFISFFNYLYGKYILKDFHNLICINIK
jgi:exopolysaccharide biosynthesis WecB/TagA/CpsF family protein